MKTLPESGRWSSERKEDEIGNGNGNDPPSKTIDCDELSDGGEIYLKSGETKKGNGPRSKIGSSFDRRNKSKGRVARVSFET